MKRIIVLILVVSCISLNGNGQEKDTLAVKKRLNGISFNPTPMILCNTLKNVTFVYERMVAKNRSLAFQLGYLEFNPSLLDSIIKDGSIRQKTSYGVNVALQYRFYPSRLNAQPAPFGLYWGPFLSYYGLNTTSTFQFNETAPTQLTEVKTGYNMINLGIGVGYQFVIREKISIDLLAFGPSLTYSFKNKKTSGPMPPGGGEISNLMLDSSETGYPLLSQFININGSESSASIKTFFRYAVTFGYRF
jgi:hypothetical protein